MWRASPKQPVGLPCGPLRWTGQGGRDNGDVHATERAEPALYLSTTCTDPAWRGHRPGALLAAWALEHAAGNGAAWLRRSCDNDRLLRYYRDVQGFTVVRTVVHTGTTHLLARATGRHAPPGTPR
ncbi:GNAT family N-acetyltransferase [Streptomyces sp. NPDC057794]|uniref:GNAT family N-acetyltransferase n=1 Tax=Streptomyces sp. NPDC057794 TaxID=3346251 RepID=UPI0036848BC4